MRTPAAIPRAPSTPIPILISVKQSCRSVFFHPECRLGVDKVIVVAHSLGAQVALRAARARPGTVRALVLVAPAVLNPLDSKFVMGRDPNANLFSAILNLRTRVEMTAKLAAFNLQVCFFLSAPS